MADIVINPVTRRVQFTGNTGTGPFAFTFNILSDTDIVVYKNTTLLTLTTDYTVSINVNGTGSITLTGSGNGTALITSDILTIIGGRELSRVTDFVTAGDLLASSLNTDLDSLTVMAQQLDEKIDRSLKASAGDADASLEIPLKADRLGRVLGFNSTTGNAEAGPLLSDVSSLADISTDIALLADIEDGTIATNAITTVSGNSSNVTTVAGISSDVTTVSSNTSNINTIATNLTGSNTIGTVASNITNVNTVAGINTAVSSVASNTANINAVAADSADIGTVASNIVNVNAVGGDIANVNTVAGISSDITAVVADATDIGTVATDLTGSNNIGTVAGSISNVNSVGGSISDVTTVASNLTDVQSFANVYRIGSADPTTSLDTGDLFFNTTSSALKVYDGTAWTAGVTAGSGFLPTGGGGLTGDVTFADSVKAIFGTGQDLQIYHDGSNTYIAESGTGDLRIQGAAVTVETTGGNLYFKGDADVAKLYHTNNEKLATTATGVAVTGGITLTTDLAVADGGTGASDAATARSNLGVDAAGTDNSTDVTLAGSLDYLTLSGQEITVNSVDLTTDVTGALPVANGGTGATTVSAAQTNLQVDPAGTAVALAIALG